MRLPPPPMISKKVAQHVRHLGHQFGFSKNCFSKILGNFLKLSRKHVFIALNRNISKNRVEKKKLEQNFVKTIPFLVMLNKHN